MKGRDSALSLGVVTVPTTLGITLTNDEFLPSADLGQQLFISTGPFGLTFCFTG